MSIFGVTSTVPENYIITLINSTFISCYVDNFVNNTQTFQINDARQLPIVVPSKSEIETANRFIMEAIHLKKTGKDIELLDLQKLVDEYVEDTYHL